MFIQDLQACILFRQFFNSFLDVITCEFYGWLFLTYIRIFHTKIRILQICIKSIMVHSAFLTLAETHGLIPFYYDFSSFFGDYLIRTEVTLPDEGIGQAD